MGTALRPIADPQSLPAVAALDAAIDRIRAADDFPAISGRIQQLMEVLGDEDASVQRLANVVIQDYSLTLKLLRSANSFKFNRSGTPVLSATHAIVMMGAEAVRDIVGTIVVWEHFRRRSPNLRPLLMLSLLSANHAREVAIHLGSVGREEAYFLGMLRNLGEVLVACYMPDRYAAVLADMSQQKCSDAISCRRILHFEYEELARAIVAEWRMPDAVARTMTVEAPSDMVETVVAFSHRLTTAVYRNSGGSSHQAVSMLLQKYSTLDLTREDVTSMLSAAIDGTRETFDQAGVRLNELQLKHQMAVALTEPVEATPVAATEAGAATADAPPSPAAPQASTVPTTRDVKAALANDALELNKIILVILEATLHGGGFDRAVLALVSSTQTEICARLGLGGANDDYIARFRFPLGPTGGRLGMAISRRQELMLAKSNSLLPDEQKLMKAFDAGAALMLPVVVGGRVVGALYVDTTGPNPFTDASIAVARDMRDAIVTAMTRRR